LNCRHCQSPLSLSFLDLGVAPPSNAYLKAAAVNAPEVWLPLRLLVCENCWLVQAEDYAASEVLFSPDYAYFSSFSSSWLEHSERYSRAMISRFDLNTDSVVCEIAANDGYLLQYFQREKIPCYGIEPTASTAEAARSKGIEIVQAFFGKDLAKELCGAHRSADLIAANNVLAHVPDINDFTRGVSILLKADGVATFEFPHLVEMVRNGQFDTAYHEHYSYLSLTSVSKIFASSRLRIFDVERLSTHGGSLRVFAQRSDTGKRLVTPAVPEMLDLERSTGLTDRAYYLEFQGRAERIKNDAVYFLIDAKRKGLGIGAYGAAAKGNTLLNFAGVRPDLLPYVVDRNPAKQGQFMPGSRIPIVSEKRLFAEKPEFIIVLPWNLKEELSGQLAYVRDWGGRLVTFVPNLEIS
jgi:C-methyltransferase C-terminal domain/Putative zinc binding domain/Methyltransferase domain